MIRQASATPPFVQKVAGIDDGGLPLGVAIATQFDEELPGLVDVRGPPEGTERVHLDRHVDGLTGEPAERSELLEGREPLFGVVGGEAEKLADDGGLGSQRLGLTKVIDGALVSLLGVVGDARVPTGESRHHGDPWVSPW